MARKPTPQNTEVCVLLRSRRRCAICFGLNRDTGIKPGQIAHIDQDNTNSKIENLAFLCLEHHDKYDSKTSQSKGITAGELKHFRDELYAYVKTEQNLTWPDYPETETSFSTADRPLLAPEIYDRKIQVYRTVQDFLGVIISEATVSREKLFLFASETDEAIFLFDSDLSTYLRKLYRGASRLKYTHDRLDDQRLPVGEKRSRLAEENAKLLTWFSEQFEVSRRMFYKHIALG